MRNISKIFPIALLCLSASFAQASEAAEDTLDIRNNPNIKTHGIKNHEASKEKQSITIKFGGLQQIFIYRNLKNKKISHLAFYSKKLGKPDKEKCALINLENEPSDLYFYFSGYG